jgi:hypothetical protein
VGPFSTTAYGLLYSDPKGVPSFISRGAAHQAASATSAREGRNYRWNLANNPVIHVDYEVLLHAAKLGHGTDTFTSPPKNGRLRIFTLVKIQRLRPGLNSGTRGHIWGVTSELVQFIKSNHVLTKGKPTVTSFPNMQSVVLDYNTIHYLTHIAVTRLASYWTACFRYLLVTVFSFKSLSIHNPSYLSSTVLECTLSV